MSVSDRKTLVIVDDEQAYLDMLEQVLPEVLDCPIRTFTRPLAALAVLREIDIGLVVSDYDMPQLNGFDFLRQLQELLPRVPSAILTGQRVQFNTRELAQIANLKVVLRKPIDWRQLAQEVDRLWCGQPSPLRKKCPAC